MTGASSSVRSLNTKSNSYIQHFFVHFPDNLPMLRQVSHTSCLLLCYIITGFCRFLAPTCPVFSVYYLNACGLTWPSPMTAVSLMSVVSDLRKGMMCCLNRSLAVGPEVGGPRTKDLSLSSVLKHYINTNMERACTCHCPDQSFSLHMYIVVNKIYWKHLQVSE